MTLFFLSLFLPLFCRAWAAPVHFKASDGVAIAADFRPPAKRKPVFLLLHGLGSSRGEWSLLVSSLTARGYGSLALDARGHGSSGGPPYAAFRTPEAWAALERDLDGALSYLERAGYPQRRVILAGASIGANLALRAATGHARIPFALLFSPGLDYQGITIEDQFRIWDKPVLLAAAPDDPYAMQTCQRLAAQAKSPESRLLQARKGHGVRMFEGPENQEFVRRLFEWIDRRVRASSPSGNPAFP